MTLILPVHLFSVSVAHVHMKNIYINLGFTLFDWYKTSRALVRTLSFGTNNEPDIVLIVIPSLRFYIHFPCYILYVFLCCWFCLRASLIWNCCVLTNSCVLRWSMHRHRCMVRQKLRSLLTYFFAVRWSTLFCWKLEWNLENDTQRAMK